MTSESARRVLIVYATWTGATRSVAEAVAEVLRGAGAEVTLGAASKIKSAAGYDAVLLGTGVHPGKLPGTIIRFARRNAGALKGVPSAWFLVCLTMAEDKPETRQTALDYLKPLRAVLPGVEPVDTGLFAGAVLNDTPEFEELNFLFKVPVKSMAESTPDHRNWDAIRAWATETTAKLGVDEAAPALTSA